MPTAWHYCRISQDEPASVSIETQLAAGRACAAIRCAGAVEIVLADRDVSGGVPVFERPAGSELLKARSGDHLIVARTDRICRSVVDGDRLMEWCLERRITLHLLDLGVDTSQPVGRMVAQIVMAFAQLERALISERRRAAARTRRGLRLPTMDAAHAPLGWRIVVRGGRRRFAPQESERRVCREIRRMRRRGMLWRRILAGLNARRVRRRQGRPWTGAAARRAAAAAEERFPLISADCRRWGSESGRYRPPRTKRGKPDVRNHRGG